MTSMLKSLVRGLLRLAHGEREYIHSFEVELEEDGRWLAEIVDLPGVMAYGETRDEAIKRVGALALRVMADRLEHEEASTSEAMNFSLRPREHLAGR